MAINYTALKTEIETDPVTMGYPLLSDPANDVAIADILNNANGDKGRTVDRESISTADFVGETTFAAYDGLTASETSYYDMITNRENIAVTADTKQELAGVPVDTDAIWAAADRVQMNARVIALMQRTGSRAEEIKDTIGVSFVTPSDVANARSQG